MFRVCYIVLTRLLATLLYNTMYNLVTFCCVTGLCNYQFHPFPVVDICYV